MHTCPLCENNSKVVNLKKSGDYDILYCRDCQLRFSDPMFNPGRLFYQESPLYEVRSKDYLIELHIPNYEWKYKTCLELCAAKIGQSLLDIGCGDGGFLTLAKERGFSVFGIDIDDRAVKLAKEGRELTNVISGSWEKITEATGWKDFDIITVFEMLEHVSMPVSLASTIFALLKPGGLACISVPRLDRYPRIFYKEIDSPPHHFTLWTSQALEILLRKVGFREIQIVEKPLLLEDLFLRQIRQVRGLIRKSWGRKKEGQPEYGKAGLLSKIIKESLLFIIKPINWLFTMLHLGRGFTLLAVARKPE